MRSRRERNAGIGLCAAEGTGSGNVGGRGSRER